MLAKAGRCHVTNMSRHSTLWKQKVTASDSSRGRKHSRSLLTIMSFYRYREKPRPSLSVFLLFSKSLSRRKCSNDLCNWCVAAWPHRKHLAFVVSRQCLERLGSIAASSAAGHSLLTPSPPPTKWKKNHRLSFSYRSQSGSWGTWGPD